MKKQCYRDFARRYLSDDISVSYTWKTDDITIADKPQGTPYVSRKGILTDGRNEETESRFSIRERDGGYLLTLSTASKKVSEFGLNLPLNFMGKKNRGGWQNQYLFSSPYATEQNDHIFCYFSSPSGRNLVVISLGRIDGWKVDYSLFSGGQYFDNVKFLASFDRAYGGSGKTALRLFIQEVRDYEDALTVVSRALSLPIAVYDRNYVKLGETLPIRVVGEYDRLRVGKTIYPKSDRPQVLPPHEGLFSVIPYMGRKRGLSCTAFAYSCIEELFKKSMYAISDADMATTDGNLCEWKCHVSAMLRYMMKNGKSPALLKKVKKELAIITERDESKAIPRQTIFYKPHAGYPAYHVFASNRVQEQFFGVSILLDAYKLLGTRKYLDYAIRALDCLLKHHQKADGRIETYLEWSQHFEDYTTVCCLIIPVLDMAEFLRDKDPKKSAIYYEAASGMAQHVYERGMNFPTETIEQDLAETFMEEGSISCSALTLLYYCDKVAVKPEYLSRAKEYLAVHDTWIIHTCYAPMFFSTLRWWETKWEGDKDGNALCCGHAWTIWRAEADYLLAKLTGDAQAMEKAKCGFMSNFSKINKKGQSYTCYQPDYITGGGFTTSGKEITFRVVHGFPKQTDSGLSRYAWVRGAEGILNEF